MTPGPGSPGSPGEQLVLPSSFLLSQDLCPPCLFLDHFLEGQHLQHTLMDTGAVLSAESRPTHRLGECFNFLKLAGNTEAVRS